jgi:hypothetical protein
MLFVQYSVNWGTETTFVNRVIQQVEAIAIGNYKADKSPLMVSTQLNHPHLLQLTLLLLPVNFNLSEHRHHPRKS